jgi:hypothetical protein
MEKAFFEADAFERAAGQAVDPKDRTELQRVADK